MSPVTGRAVDAEQVRAAVEDVPDPELPALTLADLGVIRDVRVQGRIAHVRLTPTYLACPALGTIKDDVRRAVARLGLEPAIEVVLAPPWHPGLISDRGRARLAAAGIAPPRGAATDGPVDLGLPTTAIAGDAALCPRCGSGDTVTVSSRGPTPCTSLHTCRDCAEPFEKVRER